MKPVDKVGARSGEPKVVFLITGYPQIPRDDIKRGITRYLAVISGDISFDHILTALITTIFSLYIYMIREAT